jgi:hypothetical protein
MYLSKELLSEVLGANVVELNKFNLDISSNIEFTLRDYLSSGDTYHIINIYELAHKCKEWARDKHDCTVSSSIYKEYSKCWAISFDESFVASTEPEAIFNATSYIMEQLKQKD